MKKNLIPLTLLATILVLGAAFIASAADVAVTLKPIGGVEAMQEQATHYVEVKYSDFTETTTNTAQVVYFTAPANSVVEGVTAYLIEAFDTDEDSYTGSMAIVVGDASDDNRFFTSTELASEGTEVFVKAGTGTRYLYTTATAVKITCTPNSEEALDDNSSGKVRIYFRISQRKTE